MDQLREEEHYIDLKAFHDLSRNGDGKKLKKFKRTVMAVHAIVSQKLYKSKSSSLENYFRDVWKISRAQVYRFLDCAIVLHYLDGMPIQPTRERVCRSVKRLARNKADSRVLWEEVLKKVSNNVDSVTSTLISSVWDDLMAQEKVTGVSPNPEDDLAWESFNDINMIEDLRESDDASSQGSPVNHHHHHQSKIMDKFSNQSGIFDESPSSIRILSNSLKNSQQQKQNQQDLRLSSNSSTSLNHPSHQRSINSSNSINKEHPRYTSNGLSNDDNYQEESEHVNIDNRNNSKHSNSGTNLTSSTSASSLSNRKVSSSNYQSNVAGQFKSSILSHHENGNLENHKEHIPHGDSNDDADNSHMNRQSSQIHLSNANRDNMVSSSSSRSPFPHPNMSSNTPPTVSGYPTPTCTMPLSLTSSSSNFHNTQSPPISSSAAMPSQQLPYYPPISSSHHQQHYQQQAQQHSYGERPYHGQIASAAPHDEVVFLLKSLAAKGYSLQPLINGRWHEDNIDQWRVIKAENMNSIHQNYLPSHPHNYYNGKQSMDYRQHHSNADQSSPSYHLHLQQPYSYHYSQPSQQHGGHGASYPPPHHSHNQSSSVLSVARNDEVTISITTPSPSSRPMNHIPGNDTGRAIDYEIENSCHVSNRRNPMDQQPPHPSAPYQVYVGNATGHHYPTNQPQQCTSAQPVNYHHNNNNNSNNGSAVDNNSYYTSSYQQH